MPRTVLALSLAALVFSVVYGFSPPAPRYYPMERTWSMEKIQGSPSMGWYGRCAWSFGAALTAYFAVRAATRRRSPGPRLARASLVAAMVSLVLLAVYMVHHELSKWG